MIAAMALTPGGDPLSLPPEERIHPVKRITLRRGLLTPRECGFLIQISESRFKPATVLASAEDARTQPRIRDSDHASFNPLEAPPFVHAITRRIAAATGSDVRQGEPIQILRYREGQQYKPHLDGVGGGSNKRVMTAIAYLNDDYSGGETAFLDLGLAVRGRPGDLLVFKNLNSDGELDREMRHAGLPVKGGVKYIASRWILERPPYDAEGKMIGKTLWS
jgi:prolyl 4-hydroxylase